MSTSCQFNLQSNPGLSFQNQKAVVFKQGFKQEASFHPALKNPVSKPIYDYSVELPLYNSIENGTGNGTGKSTRNSIQKTIASTQKSIAQEIRELNQTKEDILFSSFLHEKINTDMRLTTHSGRMWNVLFNRAKFHPNLEVRFSCRYLARLFDLSIRTIQRYLRILEKYQYVEIKENYRSNGGRQVNTLCIRVPIHFLEEGRKRNDRRLLKENQRARFSESDIEALDILEEREKVLLKEMKQREGGMTLF